MIVKALSTFVVVCGVAITCSVIYSMSKPACLSIGDTSESSSYTEGNLGHDFKFHMVSTTNPNNAKRWEWVFANEWGKDKEDSKDEEFKKEKITNLKELKDKCEEAYKKSTKGDVHGTNKDAYEKSIWRYCSVGNKKPVVVKDASTKETSDSTKIGGNESNKSELISTTDQDNDWFWDIQEQSFFKQGNKDGLGKKATEVSAKFKELYEKQDRGAEDTLRNVCSNIYKEDNTDANKKKEALMFCSLKASGDN